MINSSLVGMIQEAAHHPQIGGILGALHGIEGILHEDLVDLGKEEPSVIKGLSHTPSSALGSCRHRLSADEYEKAMAVLQAHNVRYLLYMGGNDSMDTAQKLDQLAKDVGYQIQVIGVPKTIDNDLPHTDHCPGYGSAARFIATVVRDAGLDTAAMNVIDKVKVIEVMGHNAGWVAAAAALAKEREDDAPHLIYVPERHLVFDRFLAEVQRVYERYGHAVIVASEGLRGPDGQLLFASSLSIDVDGFGHPQLGGVADLLCRLIADELRLKSRSDKPGTIQRVAMRLTSTTDVDEAYLVGQMAVRYAVEGVSGHMVTLVREPGPEYHCHTGLVELEKVANAERPLPDEYLNEAGNFVAPAFLDYARPLIGSPLPKYVRLQGHPVPRLIS